jgi:hypothetical protein
VHLRLKNSKRPKSLILAALSRRVQKHTSARGITACSFVANKKGDPHFFYAIYARGGADNWRRLMAK